MVTNDGEGIMADDRELKGLANRVIELARRNWFDLSGSEMLDIQHLDAKINGVAPPGFTAEMTTRLREIARTSRLYEPKRPEPLETEVCGKIAETEREHEEVEAKRIEKSDVWHVMQRKFAVAAERRLEEASGNSAKLAEAWRWIDGRRVEVEATEAEFRLLDTAARLTRARLNALRLVRDRLRHEAEVQVIADGKVLSLQQFEEWKRTRPTR